MLSRYSEMLSRYSEMLSRYSEMLSRYSEMLSRHSEMLSRYSEMLSRHSEMLSRYSEMLYIYTMSFKGHPRYQWHYHIENMCQKLCYNNEMNPFPLCTCFGWITRMLRVDHEDVAGGSRGAQHMLRMDHEDLNISSSR